MSKGEEELGPRKLPAVTRTPAPGTLLPPFATHLSPSPAPEATQHRGATQAAAARRCSGAERIPTEEKHTPKQLPLCKHSPRQQKKRAGAAYPPPPLAPAPLTQQLEAGINI